VSSVKPFSPFFTTLYYFGETDLHTRFLPTSLLPLRERERERERERTLLFKYRAINIKRIRW